MVELFNDNEDPSSSLEITALTAAGEGFTLFDPPAVPFSIAGGNPGPRVQVTVRFCAATPGAQSGTFTIEGASSNSPVIVALAGTGNSAPVCDANGPYSAQIGQTITFDGTGSSDPDGDTITYSWDFGDGSTGSGASPTHSYAAAGTFTVTLTVSDDCNASSQCSTSATITETPNEPPICDANGPYTGTVGQAVTFDGTGSSDPDGTIASYLWEFGDGTSGTGASPTHTYATSGTFNVELTVTDDDGASSGCGTTAEIAPAPNEPPVCDADGPYNGTVNVAVTFDGTGSSDPDGTIASYAWDFGDGGTGTGASPTHTYTAAGTFTVTLTVTDDDGASSTCTTTANITETPNEPPVCDANGPYTGTAGQAVTFDGTGSSDPDGTIASYAWDFGDGGTGTGASPTHTYATSGTFTVSLTVTDDDGASSTCGSTAEIGEAPNEPPVCDANGPYTGTAGQAVTFDGTGSSDPDGTIASYAWDFGDGGTGTGASPTHTYATSGTFTVSLTVTDDDGASSSCGSTAEIGPAPNEPPVCDADGPYNGTVNVAVTFDGTGSSDPDGTIASYDWDFGDGSTGTGASPTHTYTAAGTFTVTLTVTDDDGASSTCTSTANITETPNEPPLCDANGPYTGTAGQPVSFDGSGSSDPDGTIASYAWDFGDGGTGTGATPTHTYATSGTFTVTLTVTDDDGGSSTCGSTAEIAPAPNEPPVCDANGPYTGTAGQPVSFDGTGSSDPDGTIASYAWDFGDGETGTGATPTHIYATPGTFTVSLTVTDDDGASSSCGSTAEIAPIPNEPPTCDAGGPYNGVVNVAVTFDGTGSSDPDGTVVSYDWNFGDGATGTGASPTHTYTSTGTFTVTLLVTDDDGDSSTCTTTANITEIVNEPPLCDAGGPYSGTVGEAVSFDGTGSSDPDGTIDSYVWDFGDGGTGTGANPTHTYASAGTFTVTLTVTDNQGGSSSCTTTAEIGEVGNQPPICDANGPYNATVGESITFDGTGSSDPDGTIDSYAWDFGDGGTGTGATPTHTYASSGSFTVTLTVTDNDGASSTCGSTAEIGPAENQLPICDANGPYNATVGESITFDGTGSSDPDGTIASYAWDFGDGSTGTGATPTHAYASPGNFTVTLTVTDNEGASSTCTTTANITETPNEPPLCDANGPYSGTVGQSISFDGSGSSDPDGTIESYAWDFGDGGTGTGATPTHTYAASGNFTVTLTVTDNDGASSTCTTTAEIGSGPTNQPPNCSQARPSVSEIWPGNHQFVRVSVLGVTDPDGDPVTITIDGVTQDEPLSGPGYGNHCPDARPAGTSRVDLRAERGGSGDGRVYEISFTASDGQGGTCSGTVSVCVPKNQSPHNVCVDSGQEFDSFGPCDLPRGGEQVAGELALSASVASGVVLVDYELAQDSSVDLAVFDVTGRRLAVLVKSQQAQGAHTLSWDAKGIARGVYYVRISTPTGNLTKRVVLVR